MSKEKNLHPGRLVERNESAKPERVFASDGHQGTFYVNPDKIPSDVKYRWVRERIDGNEDENNISGALIDGWTPVPPDRHPELIATLNKKVVVEYIRRKGHILMERPAQVSEDQRNALREYNYQQVNSVKFALDGGVNEKDFSVDANKVTTTRSFQ